MKASNLVGARFADLVVIEQGPSGSSGTRWYCQCDCGGVKLVSACNLKSGQVRSCGCKRDTKTGVKAMQEQNTRHGHNLRSVRTRTYSSWANMKARCLNPNATGYHYYGGRGITVCDRWLDFENFLEDMGDRPPGRTLDRVDNDLGYSKANCKWSTPSEQNCNQRKAA